MHRNSAATRRPVSAHCQGREGSLSVGGPTRAFCLLVHWHDYRLLMAETSVGYLSNTRSKVI